VICHVGRRGSETQVVRARNLDDHLAHGDTIGPCNGI
jgi:hypothetical protein